MRGIARPCGRPLPERTHGAAAAGARARRSTRAPSAHAVTASRDCATWCKRTFLAVTNGITASNLTLSLSLRSIATVPAATAHTLKCPAKSIAADLLWPRATAAERTRITTASECQRRRTKRVCSEQEGYCARDASQAEKRGKGGGRRGRRGWRGMKGWEGGHRLRSFGALERRLETERRGGNRDGGLPMPSGAG